MPDNFQVGETDDDNAAPPIETIGARYGISVAQTGRGAPVPQREPYLMPPVTARTGGMQPVVPAIAQTPLGGLMPGPNAIAPAIVVGSGAWPVPEDGKPFNAGVADSWPEGTPVPIRS